MRIERENLHGLVIAGGQSSRMGTPKALLEYRDGLPQWKHAALLLATRCSSVYVSIAADSQIEVPAPFRALKDSEPQQGPFHAWARAADTAADCYWLSLNCDLPLAEIDTLDALLNAENDRAATAFFQENTRHPDPQCTLLTPTAMVRLRDAYRWGQRSPRRFLNTLPTHTLAPDQPAWLSGANTPEEFEAIRQSL